MKISKTEKPWGNFEEYTKNELSTVKILTVNPHSSLSLQRHKERKEFWKIIEGEALVTIGETKKSVSVGDTVSIETGELHRVETQDKKVVILEISFGNFDENDIERVEDAYGRK